MIKKVFHLPEDSAGDVMDEVGRLGRKVTGEERLRGEMVLEETYLRLAKGMGNPELQADVTIRKRFGENSVEVVARGEAMTPLRSLTEKQLFAIFGQQGAESQPGPHGIRPPERRERRLHPDPRKRYQGHLQDAFRNGAGHL